MQWNSIPCRHVGLAFGSSKWLRGPCNLRPCFLRWTFRKTEAGSHTPSLGAESMEDGKCPLVLSIHRSFTLPRAVPLHVDTRVVLALLYYVPWWKRKGKLGFWKRLPKKTKVLSYLGSIRDLTELEDRLWPVREEMALWWGVQRCDPEMWSKSSLLCTEEAFLLCVCKRCFCRQQAWLERF